MRAACHERGTMMDKKSNSAGDEAVWFSFLCTAVAFVGVYKHHSVGIGLVFIAMLSWFVWTLWKMSADRFN
jgi:Flp pilus assembly protein TadB